MGYLGYLVTNYGPLGRLGRASVFILPRLASPLGWRGATMNKWPQRGQF